MKKAVGIVFILFVLAACGAKKQAVAANDIKVDKVYVAKFHEAVRLKMQGQLQAAITLFEECASLQPKDDAVQYALSTLYIQTKQLEKSRAAIQKAAKLDPSNYWYVEELAYMYYENQNFTQAAAQFKKLIQKDPRNVEWLFGYAETLTRAGQTADAIKALDKLQGQVGANPQLSVEKYRMYRQIKQDDKGLAELVSGLTDFPQDPQLLANLVDYYFEKKQAEKAFEYLTRLAEADPTNGNAHMALAQYYDQKGDRAKSYAELNKAFQCDDIEVDRKMKLLLSMFDQQYRLDEEMFTLVNSIILKHPTDPRGYSLLGDFHLKNNDPKQALTAFQKALEFDQTRYVIWEQVMFLGYELGDFELLYAVGKQALSYFPTQSKLYLLHGLGGVQTKHYAEAEEALQTGLSYVVNDNTVKAEFLSQLAEARFGLKKTDEAIKNYREAIALIPQNSLFKNNFAYRCAVHKVNLEEALRLSKEAVSLSPDNANILDTYAWVLFQSGAYQAAKVELEKANALSPNNAVILEHLGDVNSKLGNVSEALNYWKQARELVKSSESLDRKIELKKYDESN